MGTVLLQAKCPVAYYSRKLSVAELNYSVSDIEMLVVRLALRECRSYLEGAQEPFTLVSYCQPKIDLDCANSANKAHTVYPRAHLPGKNNAADSISRDPQIFAHICSLLFLAH